MAAPNGSGNEKKVVKCLMNVYECQLEEFRNVIEKYKVPDSSGDDEPPLKVFKSENEPFSVTASYTEPGFKILESDADQAASDSAGLSCHSLQEGKNLEPDADPLNDEDKSDDHPKESESVSASFKQSDVEHPAPSAADSSSQEGSKSDSQQGQVVPSKIKYTWQCAKCSFRAITTEDLGIAELPDGKWQCNVCHGHEKPRVFSGKSAKSHAAEHFKKFHWDPPEEDSHPCQNCDKHFQAETATCSEYIQQGQVVTEKISGTWLCPSCSVNPNIKPEDFFHQLEDGSGHWKCNNCSSIFKGKSAKSHAAEHVKKIHLDQETDCLPCPRCPEHYQLLSQFKKHLKSDHNLDYKTLMKNEKVRN